MSFENWPIFCQVLQWQPIGGCNEYIIISVNLVELPSKQRFVTHDFDGGTPLSVHAIFIFCALSIHSLICFISTSSALFSSVVGNSVRQCAPKFNAALSERSESGDWINGWLGDKRASTVALLEPPGTFKVFMFPVVGETVVITSSTDSGISTLSCLLGLEGKFSVSVEEVSSAGGGKFEPGVCISINGSL